MPQRPPGAPRAASTASRRSERSVDLHRRAGAARAQARLAEGAGRGAGDRSRGEAGRELTVRIALRALDVAQAPLAFDVASIKPNNSGASPAGRFYPPSGRVTMPTSRSSADLCVSAAEQRSSRAGLDRLGALRHRRQLEAAQRSSRSDDRWQDRARTFTFAHAVPVCYASRSRRSLRPRRFRHAAGAWRDGHRDAGRSAVRRSPISDGVFRFPRLADGAWTMRVEMLGFAPLSRRSRSPADAPASTWALKLLPFGEIARDALPPPRSRARDRRLAGSTVRRTPGT